MKGPLIALLLFACLPFAAAQKVRYGQDLPKAKPGVDYSIQVHVSGIHVRQQCKRVVIEQTLDCHDVVYADATMEGKKIELMGDWIWFDKFSGLAITPGDFQARVLKGAKGGASLIGEEYELVLKESTVWRCSVTGIFE